MTEKTSEEVIKPLAERLRPQSLKDFQGQDHLTGKGKIIHSFIKNKKINSMIFWGPPGTGKTTLSRILVKELDYPAMEFSATVAKIGEIREVMTKASEVKSLYKKPLVVFIDEIHHFNKHTQDAFLPFVEKGEIILLGTTIENPAYKINRALLSRMKILEFYPLDDDILRTIMERAMNILHRDIDGEMQYTQQMKNILLHYSGGDARRMLNLMEIVTNTYIPGSPLDETFILNIIQKKIGAFDRSGDDRYQLISAFHKSIRNSDLDGSLFWLYRMLQGGEDPLFIIRRMIRISVEDIGFADPEALTICLQTKEAFDFIGSPEGELFLAQATVYLASAPKSNSLYLLEAKMKKLVDKYKNAGIPLHIINPANRIAAQKGAGKGYMYAHDFHEKTTTMKTLPEEVREKDFFSANEMGYEKKIRERIIYWKNLKEKLKKKSNK